MQSKALTPTQYLAELPADRRAAMKQLRQVIKANLPKGFKEVMQYGMISYVVPHSIYPAGYHCKPTDPLPFMSIASQKQFVAFYHMGLYANPKLYQWFISEYQKRMKRKADAGKSCFRYKKMDQIPFDLIGTVAGKITVQEWIKYYEQNIKR